MNETQDEKLALMYEMARSARASGDTTTAKRYYDMILEADPLNWEPMFYSVYYTYATVKNGELASKTAEITRCLNTTLVVVNKTADGEERARILRELKESVATVALILLSASINFYKSLPFSHADPQERFARAVLVGELLFTMGDALKQNDMAADANAIYKQAITSVVSDANYAMLKGRYPLTQQHIDTATAYIRAQEPEYNPIATQGGAQAGSGCGGCYVATCVYGSYDCPEVWTLRRYRDDTLASTWYGRAFIRLYYAVSPTLVKWFGHTAWFKKMWRGTLDRMVKRLGEQGVENTPYVDKEW